MKTRKAGRWLAILFCVAMLAGIFMLPTAAATTATTTPAAQDAANQLGAAKSRTAEPAGGLPASLVKSIDTVFNNVNFLQYYYNPWGNYIYNSKYAFQWLFGFNKLYDDFSFVANAYIDTIRCKFNFEGKDWLVQLWKGSYGVCLAIGGEIGIYNKPESFPVQQYYSAYPKDWISMEMSIYHNDKLLFTRPFDKYWWCTGFQPGYLQWFMLKPRVGVTMVATLEFNNWTMATLFTECLNQKGFTRVKYVPGVNNPEQYFREAKKVQLSWRNVTENAY